MTSLEEKQKEHKNKKRAILGFSSLLLVGALAYTSLSLKDTSKTKEIVKESTQIQAVIPHISTETKQGEVQSSQLAEKTTNVVLNDNQNTSVKNQDIFDRIITQLNHTNEGNTVVAVDNSDTKVDVFDTIVSSITETDKTDVVLETTDTSKDIADNATLTEKIEDALDETEEKPTETTPDKPVVEKPVNPTEPTETPVDTPNTEEPAENPTNTEPDNIPVIVLEKDTVLVKTGKAIQPVTFTITNPTSAYKTEVKDIPAGIVVDLEKQEISGVYESEEPAEMNVVVTNDAGQTATATVSFIVYDTGEPATKEALPTIDENTLEIVQPKTETEKTTNVVNETTSQNTEITVKP